MLKTLSLAAMLALAISSRLAGGGPAPLPSFAHTTDINGVQLTIAAGKPVYPRNALVRVTATLLNASHAVVYYPVGCNGALNPFFSVINGQGRQVDPPHVLVPAPRGPIVETCAVPLPRPVPPGHSLRWTAYLILRGHTLSVRLGLTSADYSIVPETSISTRLPVRLTAPDPPTVSLATSPAVVAHLQPRGPVYGHPRLADWWLCPGDNPANGAASRSFVPISASHVAAPCALPVQWHAVVGWFDHSVVAIDFKQP
jgi:hypothetical protein